MEVKQYLEILEGRMNQYFDIVKDHTFNGESYSIFAKSSIRSERYFVSKKVAIYALETKEFCLIKYDSNPNTKSIQQEILRLKEAVNTLVEPHHEHMCTIINGVIIIDGPINEDIKEQIRKGNYYKSFLFGIKGWSYVRLLLVQLNNGEVITNRRGKEALQFYQIK
ncbi:hypothetical protein [Alkaliphilus peptidifermentans]|uniref:DUF8052 domain-containing protein n=1 Tax=Alkaliphilus peptidifermentans DSM 18978 TaxID=1120976 RepID=A0A1G5KTP7_9FIRM|nr:hypothetical protein [Alkaliphilus peptidifermentans]SCZ04033.1 hypothetical protein SAMN03080606_03775 [Alkaliphilus peptidifermentans DSM 18978]